MSKVLRRYELLLPASFNDGKPVPDVLVGETIKDVRKRFGAVSIESQAVTGIWDHSGAVYRDANFRLFVDVADTPANRHLDDDLLSGSHLRDDAKTKW